jgi:hypothetical protein
MANVAPFISTLFDVVSDPSTDDVIAWGEIHDASGGTAGTPTPWCVAALAPPPRGFCSQLCVPRACTLPLRCLPSFAHRTRVV